MRINKDFIELCKGIIDEIDLNNIHVDWHLMCEMAYTEKILPLFLKKYHTIIPESILLDFGIKANNIYINNKKIIETIYYLQKKIDRAMILGKGCSFSQYIYGDSLIRVCKDIDLFVHENDQLYICKKMESLGFREAHFLNHKRLNRDSLLNFYNSTLEKAFVKEGYPYIEIKTSASLFEKEVCLDGIKKSITFEDYQNIKTFDLMHLFILLNSNTFVNFFSNWGISAECKIRDLIDLCLFYSKYYSFLNNLDFQKFELIKYKCINYTMLDIISANYKLISYFFGKEFIEKHITDDLLIKKNVWPVYIDKNQVLFSEREGRWKWYCETTENNPDFFIYYENIMLPIRMDFESE